jgi:3-oxoacyl-[acyl-carrier protein] reductase
LPSLLEGKKAVVTGAARGIGYAIGAELARHGASVVLADIDADALAKAEASLAEATGGAVAVRSFVSDVSDPESVDALVAFGHAELGGLDVMVNNAGITRDATMRRMSVEDFEAVLNVHLKGAWLGTRAAAAFMREQRSGSIVNISSISGKAGMAGQTNYSSAKAGMVGLTKAAAKELAYLGVRVNVVMPGLIRTPMTSSMREDIWQAKIDETPMGRAGEPAEIAGPVVFLASDLASYVTGAVIQVSGGRHM